MKQAVANQEKRGGGERQSVGMGVPTRLCTGRSLERRFSLLRNRVFGANALRRPTFMNPRRRGARTCLRISATRSGPSCDTGAMLYMIVESFRGGDAVPVYRRFRDKGRLAPEGLRLHQQLGDSRLPALLPGNGVRRRTLARTMDFEVERSRRF